MEQMDSEEGGDSRCSWVEDIKKVLTDFGEEQRVENPVEVFLKVPKEEYCDESMEYEEDTLNENVLTNCMVKETMDYEKLNLTGSTMAEHQELHHLCEECGTRFSWKESLERHYRANHGYLKQEMEEGKMETKKVAQERRDKAWTTYKKILKKVKISNVKVEGVLEVGLPLPITRRERRKVYECRLCTEVLGHPKIFPQLSNLKVHMRIHTKERPFRCEWDLEEGGTCGKSFTQFTHLTKHQYIHNGQHPFLCMECGKKFTSASNLKTHLKNVHYMELNP